MSAPTRPPVSRRRLGSLKNPRPQANTNRAPAASPKPDATEPNTETVTESNADTNTETATEKKAAAAPKKCLHCGSTDITIGDGTVACNDCFTVNDSTNIVSEITFEESAGGRATVQGATVQEGARHANTFSGQTNRRFGTGDQDSHEITLRQGKQLVDSLCQKLGIFEESINQAAIRVYSQAANLNFSAGRRVPEVIGTCTYAACRAQKQNSIMMMDIAAIVKINVFRLFQVYKDLRKELYLSDDPVGHQYVFEIEPIIERYCDQLQFGPGGRKVAEDAVKIIRRMNRDYIVLGRHPAGLVGACIILAARMNNFQRSVREVVFVAKVADVTIAKRIEEFRRTKSAALTVSDFRRYGNRMKHQHDPPSMLEQNRRRDKLKSIQRKREQYLKTRDQNPDSAVIAEHGSQAPSREPSTDNILAVSNDATGNREMINAQNETPPPSQSQSNGKRKRQDEPAAEGGGKRLRNDKTATQSSDSPEAESASTEEQPVTPPPTQSQTSRKRKEQDDPVTERGPKRLREDGSAPASDQAAEPTAAENSASANSANSGEATHSASTLTDTMTVPETQSESTRKRKRSDDPIIIDSAVEEAITRGLEQISQNTGIDSDGFRIPARKAGPPIDPAILGEEAEANEPPKKRGRRKKSDEPPPVILSEEELADEDWLETQMEEMLEQQELQTARNDEEASQMEEMLLKKTQEQKDRADALAEKREEAKKRKNNEKPRSPQRNRDENDERSRDENDGGDDNDVDVESEVEPSNEEFTAEELEAEFANDPEVQNCLLTTKEVMFKEQIWVTHNEDWLRAQARKVLAEKAAKASGKPSKRGRKKGESLNKDGSKRKKYSKIGDGSVLTEGDKEITTSEEATMAMLKKRAPPGQSNNIDFSMIERIYGRKTPTPTTATATSTTAPTPEDSTSPAVEAPAQVGEDAEQATGDAVDADNAEQATAGAEDDDDDDEPEDEEAAFMSRFGRGFGGVGGEFDDDDDGEDDYRRVTRGYGVGGDEFEGDYYSD